MNRARVRALLAVLAALLAAPPLHAQASREPHLGYVFPAGGRRDSTVRVMIGGQFLRGVDAVHVSGGGVRGTVIEHVMPLSLNDIGRWTRRIRWYERLRQIERTGKGTPPPEPEEDRPLPDHPLVRNLEQLGEDELVALRERMNDPKRQPNAQIGETVVMDLSIDADASPGDRELRLSGPGGLTNPLCFQIGSVLEVSETPEPFGAEQPPSEAANLPVLFNGQVMPGDVDRFRFRARRGQTVVIQADARRLVPYLADAVPGWFQATLTLYNEQGYELAFADDYRFDPDPVLCYEIPESGDYEVEIRDSIYRGREDFVYRISVAQQPFITSLFPLGATEGSEAVAALGGWNLDVHQLKLDTAPGPDRVRWASLGDNRLSNGVPFVVDALPDVLEAEPNNVDRQAQAVELPVIVNGRIGKPGDVDLYAFRGRAGQTLVAEITARRLRSPLDSLVRLLDADGKVVAWNDDQVDPACGLITHHADSYLRCELPADGDYRVQVLDAQSQGGEAFGYRLRLSPPQPDFELRTSPSHLTLSAGRTAALSVHALRRDGFDGEIQLALAGAPDGFALGGGWIPAGSERIRVTLTAPPEALGEPAVVHLEGRAEASDRTVTRRVVPADDMMQAFAYWHLVPAKELLVSVVQAGGVPRAVLLPESLPVELARGSTVEVPIRLGRRATLENVQLQLSEPPAGVTLQKPKPLPNGFALVFKVDDAAEAGGEGNLIVELFADVAGRRRVPLGVLPAVPYRIVSP